MRKDTKACDFSRTVKREIADRDCIDGWPCCIRCGHPAPEYIAYSNAHFIPRSQGGLGIARNGLTLCPLCHRRYDQSHHRAEDRTYYEKYLKSIYPDWDEKEVRYQKDGQ